MTAGEAVAAYVAAWNETDETARRALLDKSWSANGVYEDPLGVVEPGRAALSRHIAQFHARYPGAKLAAIGDLDHHHGKIYFAWRLIAADGSAALDGRDFGELDADGRISRIVGFFTPQGR